MLQLQQLADLSGLPGGVRERLSSVRNDVAQLADSKRRASLLGLPEDNSSTSGQHAQHIVERLFAASKNGVLYLQSGVLSSQAQAQLRNPGQHFSVAGKIELKNKMLEDGPCIMLEFTVPPTKAVQYKHYLESTGMHDFMAEPAPFDPAPFCTVLGLDQAERLLMTIVAPMWPVIN